ncbi:DUF4331 family protein [Sediminibacter sp. Hel_I_10]|uniref:DUF4331 family protein n=1 Tax=Sediminibacter sp. Hel_I_10 TaxID=1392490 RepID=UPI00047ABF3F|nr:DUF4331 family protein [Sediminibacter sp. Hel_I_10]
MKKSKLLIGAVVIAMGSLVAIAADHIDAPAVAGTSSDITDYYAFQGQDESTIAFVANTQGFISPADTGAAQFDEDVIIEFNIDTDGDATEDLVIQAVARDGKMYVFGPAAPSSTGLNSTILTTTPMVVDITAYGTANPVIASSNGMRIFAGPRDDPFFFDFTRYNEVLEGAPGFSDPGTDTFAASNVMSIVVEVPKDQIGGTGTINTWVESKRKQ